MKRALDVYLHQHLTGQLLQDEDGQMLFSYGDGWLETPGAVALSNSLPLRREKFRQKECRGFFAGILPEQNQRDVIAKNLGISKQNNVAMLEKIGGECAGAVTFVPAGQKLPERNDQYRSLSQDELAKILKQLPRRPLLAGEKGVRLSLAGAQDKIAVHVAGGEISVPLGGAPSTHILKPAIERFEGTVFNEAFCMKLAEAAGLQTAKVAVGKADEIDYLLVGRYDRKTDGRLIERLHQEDFCQAWGIVPENKYQNEGGPSLKQCFGLVRESSSVPLSDLQQLLDAVIFNFLVGNNDAHGKNFSLIYHGTEKWLAPFYDVLSTVYYPELSKKMAMKIGREYDAGKILPRHFEQLAEEAGLARPMVRRRVSELAEIVLSKLPTIRIDHRTAKVVADLIRRRCENVFEKFTT